MVIYYFSATGNSLKTALDIANENPGAKIIRIAEGMQLTKHPDSAKVGFIFPVYMGLLPDIVRRFVTNFPVKSGVYYFAVGTHFLYKGVAMSEIRNIFKKKGLRFNYINDVTSVGNCLMEYQVPEKTRKPFLKRADKKGCNIANDIKNGKQRKTSVFYCQLSKWIHQGLFNWAFKNAYKKFSLEDSCIACGKCVKACPVDNIEMIDNKPVWGNKCIACHACVHWCPKNAVNLGRSKGRLQYRNPQITYKQLFNV